MIGLIIAMQSPRDESEGTARLQLERDEQRRREDSELDEQRRREDRELEEQRRREAKEREEQRRRNQKEGEAIKAIPAMALMTRTTEMADYLDLFEEHQARKKVPRVAWSGHLIPLLNDRGKEAVAPMAADIRANYNSVKSYSLQQMPRMSKTQQRRFGHRLRT